MTPKSILACTFMVICGHVKNSENLIGWAGSQLRLNKVMLYFLVSAIMLYKQ